MINWLTFIISNKIVKNDVQIRVEILTKYTYSKLIILFSKLWSRGFIISSSYRIVGSFFEKLLTVLLFYSPATTEENISNKRTLKYTTDNRMCQKHLTRVKHYWQSIRLRARMTWWILSKFNDYSIIEHLEECESNMYTQFHDEPRWLNGPTKLILKVNSVVY